MLKNVKKLPVWKKIVILPMLKRDNKKAAQPFRSSRQPIKPYSDTIVSYSSLIPILHNSVEFGNIVFAKVVIHIPSLALAVNNL